MMKQKRYLSLLLCAIMLSSLLSGCGGSAEPSNSTENLSAETELEIQTAIDLGLVPEELQKDYGKAIQYNEFCAMLTEVIRLRYGDGVDLNAWLENAAVALENTDAMTRGGGAEAIFAAALSVGMDDYHSGGYLQEDIDGRTQGKATEGLPWREDLFPVLREVYHNKNWGESYEQAFEGAMRYVWHRTSAVSHKTLLEYDPDTLSMRYQDAFTRAESIAAALRCYEAWTPRTYVATDDALANTYDSDIITEELLQKTSTLPEVTHEKLPSEWQGLCLYSKGTTKCSIFDSFRERDIRFLAENNMNFARLYLSFTSLRYPDFPEDGGQVNLAELQELDQMIAWAMEYDVHLSLCMLSPPGYDEEEDSAYQCIEDHNWPEPERWDLIRDYWTMLTNRYADIPAKNLTFELCAEWGSGDINHIAEFSQRWSEIVSELREISPDRVLIASFDTADESRLVLAEEMAAIGVSIATHPYYPSIIHNHSTQRRAELGFTQEVQWPMIWFPTRNFNDGVSPLRLSGEIGGTLLTITVGDEEIYPTETGEPTVTVSIDGSVIDSYTFTSGGAKDSFAVSIPAGATEVILSHTGYFQLYCLNAEGEFGTGQILATDAYGGNSEGNAILVLRKDGSWASQDGRLYDADTFYSVGLLPYMEMADKYGVGFMVNEFVFFSPEENQLDPISMDAYLAYYADCIDVFEKYGIGYASTFLSHNMVSVIGDARERYSAWSNYPNYIGTQTYTYATGFSETFPVNNTLLDLLNKHMVN